MLFVFFFFKQKTAYEMRISDWSSDVCSSDLLNFDLHFRFHKPDDDGGRRRANVAKGSAKRRANLVPIGGVGEIIGRADHIGEREARLPERLLDHAKRVFRLFRSEEHTSELQSLMRISYDCFCLKTKKQ